jgi:serine/threonine protein kinase
MSIVGTPLYVAPEIIMRKSYEKECDCWSIGVIMYILLSGKEPFMSETLDQVYSKIKKAEFDFKGKNWTSISDEAKDLIN